MGRDRGGGGSGARVAEILSQFDWKNPDYSAVFAERARRLAWLRADDTGERLAAVRAYYATDEGVIDFISDWGMTFDPRLAEVGQPTIVPFILFPKQREFLQWALQRWRNQEPGVADKSRDWGLTWLAIALSCTLGLFREGLHIGFGSPMESSLSGNSSTPANARAVPSMARRHSA